MSTVMIAPGDPGSSWHGSAAVGNRESKPSLAPAWSPGMDGRTARR
jgi:hypothetical protein